MRCYAGLRGSRSISKQRCLHGLSGRRTPAKERLTMTSVGDTAETRKPNWAPPSLAYRTNSGPRHIADRSGDAQAYAADSIS